MAGAYDSDFDHPRGHPVTDALGMVLIVGDEIAHVAKIASRTRITKRTILALDYEHGTMTISPSLGRFATDRTGKNVKGANVVRLCQCQSKL